MSLFTHRGNALQAVGITIERKMLLLGAFMIIVSEIIRLFNVDSRFLKDKGFQDPLRPADLTVPIPALCHTSLHAM